ncbi:N-acetylmuramoyl-L-alanine amidase [Halobacillus sp. A5]|uniref:N-acetylmuramoyl-L-alanine amidase family protein n=1 Tax=Halobacillus sp. A5 TaxID=2880263 RepID=UPI0020A66AF3|nr:N-acetylmuramoyl-L-alanine amidase [Halobacillus sp. A5]MCP3025430.1 N-acetylmuramoyl-L-alanine amidase [Halobacillus sp. A5]
MAKIGLDYGHGNNTFPPDKGLRKGNREYHEHNFNSKLGLKVKKLLEHNGHEVVEGQKANSKDVDLTTRTNLYNREKVDLVWSIHANAGDKSASGRCAFYWHTAKDSKKAAELFIDEVKKAGYSTHGSGLHASKKGSWTNLHICRETNMTAVLTENGFMTNNKDFELIFGNKQEEYTDKMAEVHVKAISRFFGEDFKAQTSKPKYNLKKEDRIGEVELKQKMNYRTEPNLDASIMKKLPKGHGSKGNCHLYEVKGYWLRLGQGWISNKDNKYAKVTMYKDKPKGSVYRVIIDGKQVGAYADDKNVTEQVKKAVESGKENVEVKKV